MRIGLDFDGVLTDCGRLKTLGAQRLYGVDIPPHLFKKEIVVGQGILSMEQYRCLQREIYHSRELGLMMDLVPGADLCVRQLMSLGHEVVIITSREREACEIALEWMHLHHLETELIGVGFGISKANVAARKSLDTYVDDDLDKLVELVGVVPHLFLFSWGYNERNNEFGIAKRVRDWTELLEAIVDLETSHG